MPIPPLILAGLVSGARNLAGGLRSGASGLIEAGAMMSEEDEERLKELQRRAERDALGLTGHERGVMEQTLTGGIQAVEAEERARRGDLLASKDVGAGATFRALQGGVARAADRRREAAEDVARADIEERQREEAELQELSRLQAQQEAARKQAMVDMVLGSVEAAASTTGDIGAAKMALDETGTSEEASRFIDFFSQFGG